MTTTDELIRAVTGAYPVSADHLGPLRSRLAAAAETAGTLDVAYRTVDSPVGSLLLAATPAGLVRVAYASEDHDAVLQQLSQRISARVLRAPVRLEPVVRELDEYFDGRRRQFDVALDWSLSSGYRSVVLHHLDDIAYGRTASYAEVARLTDNPKAVRAVGSACATNPLPVVVPCHRVVRSDGSMGGYLGGLEAKRSLLELESGS